MLLERNGDLDALTLVDRAEVLNLVYNGADAQTVVRGVIAEFGDQVALVSSFGADAAVLLHMVARVNPDTPVLMLETKMLFQETLDYQLELSERLGLTNVRHLHPDPADLARLDPDDTLHRRNADACCDIRKVAPLDRAQRRWPVSITGRKRYQVATRADLRTFEAEGELLKVNPLVAWSAQGIRDYMTRHKLPLHPLVSRGYPSIGCAPCTTPVAPGEDQRAGRWRGSEKVECGIHFGADGRVIRAS